ncbi:transcription antiterminator [Clostridium boliviensis]|uniref:Transcription antiterminator n=1 Tax=Clostridium boliviensis TaxID=318465 RepID=A0ABU4GIB4_9CLOT|nr:transcription antiterminator [Clostridium boliviensis]MDW2796693.1 transcription antiterminator [Clostridium boliviensis]
MLNRRQQLLFSKFTSNQYITAAELARQLELSEKTVRTRVKELDKELLPCGAHVISKQGYGYRISITDEVLYQKLIMSVSADKQVLPTSSQERILYLLSCFLNSRDYVKLDDLSSFLFISRNVLTGDLKKAEEMLSKYGVRLVRKPHYGIRAEGTEFDKRLCISNYLMKPDFILQGNRRRSTDEMRSIGDTLLSCIREHSIKLSEVLFQNLIIHIYIAAKRMKAGLYMTAKETDYFQTSLGEKEMVIAQNLAKGLESSLGIVFSEPEIKYLAIHLAGKRSIGEENGESLKLEIPRRLMDLITELLQSVYDSFKIDFRQNQELILSLSQHMVPLDIRIRYDMGIDNPLLEETKKNYFLAYAIARQACIVLNSPI